MEFTQEQIEGYKKKYGRVFKIECDNKTALLRTPNRKQLAYVAQATQSNALKGNEVLLNECWIDGDEELRSDDACFLGISAQLSKLIEIRTAELSEL